MNNKELIEYFETTCQRIVETVKVKNADYTGENEDPFINFSSVELGIPICSTEAGFLVRMNDKFNRIKSFCKIGILKVKDESVEDTLIDFAGYCILMAGYIKSKKKV